MNGGGSSEQKLHKTARQLHVTVTSTDISILKLLAPAPMGEGKYASQVAESLGMSPRMVSYHIGILKKAGLILEKMRDVFKSYELTEEGKKVLSEGQLQSSSSGTTRPKLRLHAMQATMRIVKDAPLPDSFWDSMNTHFRGWVPKYKKLPQPIGMTINKTTKDIVIYVYARELDDPKEARELANRACLYVYQYMLKHRVVLDIWSARIESQQYAMDAKTAQEVIRRGVFVEVGLGRPAEKLLPGDKPPEALAWVDWSKKKLGRPPEVESNDLEYATRYIMMPEMVANILALQERSAELDVRQREIILQQNEKIDYLSDAINKHIPALVALTGISKELKRQIQQRGIKEFMK